ncbi:Uma2 family endonuclease [Thermus sp.]|uniref:Uma2 family endonuclease n=1 Tax=Thermus sp. TaxID=275 RepID=UPI00307D8EE1
MTRHRFSVEDFHRMVEAGILSEDDRVEPLEGEVVEPSPVGKRHMATVKKLMDAFFPLQARRQALLQVQDPLRLSPDTEPQPDLAILRFREDFYAEKIPEAEDPPLVIEVAESSLDYDLKVKLPLYARAGVLEVWVVDLENRRVLVHRNPEGRAYREALALGPGESLDFLGVRIPLEELL